MHNSAIISFGTGLLLFIIGIAAISKTRDMRQLMFAAIPLLFALQQMMEGFLYLLIPKLGYASVKGNFACVNLIIAEAIWPVWIPLAILLLERGPVLKNTLRIFSVAGAFISVYVIFTLLTYRVDVHIVGGHILYRQHLDMLSGIPESMPYLFITIMPYFFSGFKRMWMLGITGTFCYILSKLLHIEHLLPMWNIYGALISLLIYYILSTKVHDSTIKPLVYSK